MVYEVQKGIKTLIDTEDLKRILELHWYYDGKYIVNTKRYGLRKLNKHKKVYLHRFLMNLKIGDKLIVDHKDRNPLNNQKSNLRICTQVENLQNKGMQSNNTSGVTGVIWSKRAKLWIARGHYKNKVVWTKYFKNFEDAVKSREEFKKEYFTEIKI